MDVEKLINLIHEHKCLWDQSDSSYHLRDLQRKAWRGISEEMETSVDEIKKKWRGLRDTFGKELKIHIDKKSGQAADTEPGSKWPYFKLLLFLRNTMSRRDLKSSVPDTDEISDGEDSANTSTCSKYLPPSASSGQSLKPSGKLTPKKIFKSPKTKIKRRQPDEIDTRLLQIKEEKLKCLQESANDPDAQFLMSLLLFLKDNPKHRKLMVRAKLQQVLIDEQNAISSAVLFDSSSDSTQYSVDFSMPQKNSSQGQMQQSLNILPQQLSDNTFSIYYFTLWIILSLTMSCNLIQTQIINV